MSILCIGNSHLACIKEAWTSPAQDVDYICGTGNKFFESLTADKDAQTLSLVEIADERLRVLWQYTYGNLEVNLKRYSMVVVVGLGEEVNPWTLSNCSQQEPRKIDELSPHPPLSFKLWKEINNVRYRLGRMRIVRNLLIKAGAPRDHIYFIKIPLRRLDAGQYDEKFGVPQEWKGLTEEQQKYLLANEQKLHDTACEMNRVRCLQLPDELRENGGGCPIKFSIGSLGSLDPATGKPKSWGDSPEDSLYNLNHKNTEYGKVWVSVLESVYRDEVQARMQDGEMQKQESPHEAKIADAQRL